MFLSSNSWGQIEWAFGQYYNWLDPPESSIWVYLWPGYRGWESRDFSEEVQGLWKHPKNHSLLHDLEICHLWFILYPSRHLISKTTLIKKKPFYIMLLWEARTITALMWKEFLPEQLALSVNIADDLGSWDLREHQILLTYFPDGDTKVQGRGVIWWRSQGTWERKSGCCWAVWCSSFSFFLSSTLTHSSFTYSFLFNAL